MLYTPGSKEPVPDNHLIGVGVGSVFNVQLSYNFLIIERF